MIAIIDYGSGNVSAIANIYKQLKIPYCITDHAETLAAADRYILPGVGAFDTTMQHLRDTGLIDILNHAILTEQKKVLGICVGMQILAESSEEGQLPGLGWIPGQVKKIDASKLAKNPKLPHMGWNSITATCANPLLHDVDISYGFYFLHSYYFAATQAANVFATTDYGQAIPCAVVRNNIFGVQFHPEKSHANGMALFRNFAAL